MLDVELLLKPVIASSGKSPMQTLNDAGVNYNTYRMKMRKQENVRLSFIEKVAHALGYRLELRIIDNEGNTVSKSISDPDKPLLTEEYVAKFRELAERNILNGDPQERLKHSLETRRRNREERMAAKLDQGEAGTDK